MSPAAQLVSAPDTHPGRPPFALRRYFYRHAWLRGRALMSPARMVMICALGTCMFLGSVLLIGAAEWLRRMGTQPFRGAVP